MKAARNRDGGNMHLSHGVVLALQGALGAVPLASAMRTPLLLLAALFASAGLIRGEIKTPENAPIEITSTGETTYENGLATAHDNVAIHTGNTDIYADYAQYNSATHEVELKAACESIVISASTLPNTVSTTPKQKRSGRSVGGLSRYLIFSAAEM